MGKKKCKGRKKKERVGGRKAEEGRNKTPTIDQKEEGASLICHGTSNESLSGARGPVKQDSSRRLHTNGSEQLGVAQGELHHLRREKCHVSMQCTHMHTHTHTHTHTHARTHARTHAHTLAHPHPHNHTHTNTYLLNLSQLLSAPANVIISNLVQ